MRVRLQHEHCWPGSWDSFPSIKWRLNLEWSVIRIYSWRKLGDKITRLLSGNSVEQSHNSNPTLSAQVARSGILRCRVAALLALKRKRCGAHVLTKLLRGLSQLTVGCPYKHKHQGNWVHLSYLFIPSLKFLYFLAKKTQKSDKKLSPALAMPTGQSIK